MSFLEYLFGVSEMEPHDPHPETGRGMYDHAEIRKVERNAKALLEKHAECRTALDTAIARIKDLEGECDCGRKLVADLEAKVWHLESVVAARSNKRIGVDVKFVSELTDRIRELEAALQERIDAVDAARPARDDLFKQLNSRILWLQSELKTREQEIRNMQTNHYPLVERNSRLSRVNAQLTRLIEQAYRILKKV